jgi:hypothetical protein
MHPPVPADPRQSPLVPVQSFVPRDRPTSNKRVSAQPSVCLLAICRRSDGTVCDAFLQVDGGEASAKRDARRERSRDVESTSAWTARKDSSRERKRAGGRYRDGRPIGESAAPARIMPSRGDEFESSLRPPTTSFYCSRGFEPKIYSDKNEQMHKQ